MISHMVPSRISLTAKTMLLFGVILALQMTYVGVLWGLVQDTSRQVEQSYQGRKILGSLAMLLHHLVACTVCDANRAYHRKVEQSPEYQKSKKHAIFELNRLQEMVAESGGNTRKVDELRDSSREMFALFDDAQSLQRSGMRSPTQMAELALRLRGMMNDFAFKVDDLEADYSQREDERAGQLAFQSALLINLALLLGFGINAAVAILIYNFFIGSITNRLRAISQDVSDLAAGRSLLAAPPGDDEIARLAIELRNMTFALNEYRVKARTVLDNAANLLLSLDANASILTVSPTSRSILGYTAEELAGKNLGLFVAHEDVDTTLHMVKSVFAEKIPLDWNASMRSRDGRIVELAWKARLADDGHFAVCVAQDVTERNKAQRILEKKEEELSSMLERLPVSVVTCDKSFGIASINTATTDLFGYQARDLLGKNLSVILLGVPTVQPSDLANWSAMIDKARHETVELRAWRQDKSLAPVEFNIRNFPIKKGEIVLATFRDITARTEIELVKQDFVSMISHDLRSPLTSMHATLGLMLQQQPVTDEPRDYSFERGKTLTACLKDSEQTVSSLVDLINDFLDLEKFEARRIALDMVPTRIADLLSEVVSLAETNHGKRSGIKYSSSASAPGDRVLPVDRQRMIHALDSLLALVSAFCDDDDSITIAAGIGSSLQLQIGAGSLHIPDQVKENCFRRYALVKFPDHSAKLSGLSLLLAKSIITAHHGQVSIIEKDEQDFVEVKLPL